MRKPFAATLGFTLLELVMTLVLFGLVAIVAVSYFSKAVTHIDIPIKQLQTDARLQLVLENMIADNDLSGQNLLRLNTALGTSNIEQSTYGSGNNYVVSDKRFVCPSDGNFVNNTNASQFLLVTIKPEVNSDVSLTYIFGSKNAIANCNVNALQ